MLAEPIGALHHAFGLSKSTRVTRVASLSPCAIDEDQRGPRSLLQTRNMLLVLSWEHHKRVMDQE